MRQHFGDEGAERTEAFLRGISESYAEWSLRATFGEIWQRDALSLRDRELVTVAIVATLGVDSAIRHLNAALRLGITGDEIVEVLVQVAAYAGGPRSSAALAVAGEVFKENGVTVA